MYGLDLRVSSTITDMREAVGGRQPAASKPPCNTYDQLLHPVTMDQLIVLIVYLVPGSDELMRQE